MANIGLKGARINLPRLGASVPLTSACRPSFCACRVFAPCDAPCRWLYYWKHQEAVISKAQRRAIQNYRSRLGERGLARFEVLGRDGDRDLIRSLARKLAEDTAEASELRATVSRSIAGEPPRKGGILAALRRSPLVGADIDLTRPREAGRKVDL